jgi:multidrug transporter EmrE-like cation transporter
MNLSTFAFLLSGILLNATAQLCLKAGTNRLGAISLTADNWFQTGLKVATNVPIVTGLACYVFSVLFWIIGLSRTDVSLAYPLNALGFLAVPLGAWMFLGEVISPQRMLAIGVIAIGVALLARS